MLRRHHQQKQRKSPTHHQSTRIKNMASQSCYVAYVENNWWWQCQRSLQRHLFFPDMEWHNLWFLHRLQKGTGLAHRKALDYPICFALRRPFWRMLFGYVTLFCLPLPLPLLMHLVMIQQALLKWHWQLHVAFSIHNISETEPTRLSIRSDVFKLFSCHGDEFVFIFIVIDVVVDALLFSPLCLLRCSYPHSKMSLLRKERVEGSDL